MRARRALWSFVFVVCARSVLFVFSAEHPPSSPPGGRGLSSKQKTSAAANFGWQTSYSSAALRASGGSPGCPAAPASQQRSATSLQAALRRGSSGGRSARPAFNARLWRAGSRAAFFRQRSPSWVACRPWRQATSRPNAPPGGGITRRAWLSQGRRAPGATRCLFRCLLPSFAFAPRSWSRHAPSGRWFRLVHPATPAPACRTLGSGTVGQARRGAAALGRRAAAVRYPHPRSCRFT